MFQTLKLNNIALAVNYGLEKVRFPNATPAESKFRGKVSLINIEKLQEEQNILSKLYLKLMVRLNLFAWQRQYH